MTPLLNMALIPQKWTINGLAVELGFDKRRVGRLIGEYDVKPVGQEHGYDVYRMRDIVLALLASKGYDEDTVNRHVLARLEEAGRRWDRLMATLPEEIVDCIIDGRYDPKWGRLHT